MSGSFTDIISTPFVERCATMLLDCAAADAIGVVTGGHGNGKTWALRALHKRYPKLLPGTCILYRCCQARGFTRGIRDLFAEMEIGGAIVRNNSSASLQLMIKLAVREFTAQKIGCLLLDEADLWNAEALGGLISLYDVCRDKGCGFVLILAGAKSPATWMSKIPAASSRTLKIEEAPLLDANTAVAILRHWHPAFDQLRDDIEADFKPAQSAMNILHRATRGNFRKLSYFGRLFAASDATTVTPTVVRKLLKRMTLTPPA